LWIRKQKLLPQKIIQIRRSRSCLWRCCLIII
jgi:hypothetical protein